MPPARPLLVSAVAATLFARLLFCAVPGEQDPAGTPRPVTTVEERLASWQAHEQMREASGLPELHWRAIGPRFQGGRIESIAVPPRRPATIILGVGAGGLWKSTDNGLSWTAIFAHQPTMAIGDVDVSRTDPDLVWVGTGEAHLSSTSFAGTGVYASLDGGTTWESRGLRDTQHIGKVVIDPADPRTVFVAAIGHMNTPNTERGVFKTVDGGATWRRVLFVNDRVGAIDLVQDPVVPDRLLASTWQRGGGDGSALWRSTDRGETWTRIRDGFPTGPDVGRIAVDIATDRPGTAYALVVDHSPPGRGRYDVGGIVLRSDDAGKSWRRTREEYVDTYVGWDFCDIKVDPRDADTIYVCGTKLLGSHDAGKSFEKAGETVYRLLPHAGTALHLDMHDLWIDPDDSRHLLLGNDGGLFCSWDGGQRWLHLNNLPIAEFYTVAVDRARPYRIYGGTQDNASLYGPAAAIADHPADDPWRHVFLDPWAGGDGFVTLPDPTDERFIYYEMQIGDLRRKPRRGPLRVGGQGEVRIRPRAAGGEAPLRFAWNTPFIISRHDPHTVYCAAQRLFKSTDRGGRWQPISPDLTTLDAGRPGRGAILTLAESPLRSGWLYTGAGRGIIQATRDDGRHWTSIGAGLPAKRPTCIRASYHDADTVYLTLSGKGDDDSQAYLYRSRDRGRHWEWIAAGLPAEALNVVVEDPAWEGVVYVGSDRGVYAGGDAGTDWISISGDLPTASVADLVVHPREPHLIAATHGLSLFVLDLTPVREHLVSIGACTPPVRASTSPPASRSLEHHLE